MQAEEDNRTFYLFRIFSEKLGDSVYIVLSHVMIV